MAASRGQLETSALIQNLEDQLDRLVQQLADLEQCKDELDSEEYEESRKDTLEQLNELSDSLKRMKQGGLSLVDNFDRIQLAIQAAISEAFKTPEVIRMFTKKQPGQLREHLAQIERNEKIGHVSPVEAKTKKIEILTALQKLNEKLKPEEELLLKSHFQESLKQFKKVEDETIGGSKVFDVVGSQVKASGHG